MITLNNFITININTKVKYNNNFIINIRNIGIAKNYNYGNNEY